MCRQPNLARQATPSFLMLLADKREVVCSLARQATPSFSMLLAEKRYQKLRDKRHRYVTLRVEKVASKS